MSDARNGVGVPEHDRGVSLLVSGAIVLLNCTARVTGAFFKFVAQNTRAEIDVSLGVVNAQISESATVVVDADHNLH